MFAPGQKKAIVIRVNAGPLPADHWTVDPEIGGGRIVGEACHFIDLASFLAGSPIVSVSAEAVDEGARDSVAIHLAFEDGGVASLNYLTNGNSGLAKEYIEIHGSGVSAVINDFKNLTVWGARRRTVRFRRQDKGHGEELRRFIESIEQGKPCPIPFEESFAATRATSLVLTSLRSGQRVMVDDA